MPSGLFLPSLRSLDLTNNEMEDVTTLDTLTTLEDLRMEDNLYITVRIHRSVCFSFNSAFSHCCSHCYCMMFFSHRVVTLKLFLCLPAGLPILSFLSPFQYAICQSFSYISIWLTMTAHWNALLMLVSRRSMTSTSWWSSCPSWGFTMGRISALQPTTYAMSTVRTSGRGYEPLYSN